MKKTLLFFPIESVKSKASEIRKATSYSFSSEDVDKMVKQKEKFQRHPVNYAMHKARLIKVSFFKKTISMFIESFRINLVSYIPCRYTFFVKFYEMIK